MPLSSRQWKEADDFLKGWTIPTRRTAEEKRIYGPRAENLPKQLALFKELKEKLDKNPAVLMQLRADLAEREAAHPDESRFQMRLDLLRHYLTHNKKLRMKGKFQKAHFIDLYEIFKGHQMIDSIFGDDLLKKTLEKEEATTGYFEREFPKSVSPKAISAERRDILRTLEKLRDENQELFAKKASPPKTRKASPPKSAKKASPPKSKPKTAKKGKLPRCPNGTRRNKKTGKCEPKN